MPGFAFGIGAELNGKNLAKFGFSLSLGLYDNLGLGFNDGSVGFRGAVGPTINFALNRNLYNIYAGLCPWDSMVEVAAQSSSSAS